MMAASDPDLSLIVTGAGGWLGREIADAARSRVGHVIAVYKGEAPEAAAGLTTLGGVDLATQDGVQRLAQEVARAATGRLALVHCAGSFPLPKPVHSMGLENFEQSLRANALSFVGAVTAIVPAMRRRKHGRIVAFSSHTRGDNYPFFGAFNAAKAALESAVLTVAHENARFGICANAVCVATLQTEEERRIKPRGLYADWLSTKTVSELALDLAQSADVALNGSMLQYWRHSASFFGSSVFERNSIDVDEIDPE